MHTIPATTVSDGRTNRPLPGPVQVTDQDGQPIPTYTTSGTPAVPVANSWGRVADFQVDAEHLTVWLTPQGGDATSRVAVEALTRAAAVADIAEHGRLSEAELLSTIDSRVDEALEDFDPGGGIALDVDGVPYFTIGA